MISADVEGSAVLFLGLGCPAAGAADVVGADGLQPFCADVSLAAPIALLDFFFFVIFARLSRTLY